MTARGGSLHVLRGSHRPLVGYTVAVAVCVVFGLVCGVARRLLWGRSGGAGGSDVGFVLVRGDGGRGPEGDVGRGTDGGVWPAGMRTMIRALVGWVRAVLAVGSIGRG